MNSRSSGDIFEYHVVHSLELLGIKPFNETTKKRRQDLLDAYDKHNQESIAERIKINKLLDKFIVYCRTLHNRPFIHYRLNTDNMGKQGIVSDVVIVDDMKNDISLSCKKNNLSLKHQRPSNLDSHLQLDEALSTAYREKYKNVNDTLHKEIQAFKTFKDIPYDKKEKVYGCINKLVIETLQEASQTHVARLYEFIVSVEKKLVLLYDSSARQLKVYNYLLQDIPKSMEVTSKNNNYVCIKFDNGLLVQMRLHNASSRITKSLSIKYDTKICNMEEVYHSTTIG